jgi:hypothetical protein
MEGLGKLKTVMILIGTATETFPTCSLVPQPSEQHGKLA